jgi:hypothetical protein
MRNLGIACGLSAALIAVFWACLYVQRLLPDRHRTRQTSALVQLIITMMVTFSAVALGLLITAAKARFDGFNRDLRGYSIELIELNRLLRLYGPETDGARTLLRQYTATAIATTWIHEPAPPGALPEPRTIKGQLSEDSELGRMLSQVEIMLTKLTPDGPTQRFIAAQAPVRMEAVMRLRWKLIEEAPGTVSAPFYAIMAFWLLMVFASFGLVSPRNWTVQIVIVLCAISLGSAVYVLLELNSPVNGLVAVSSGAMRDALAHLDR